MKASRRINRILARVEADTRAWDVKARLIDASKRSIMAASEEADVTGEACFTNVPTNQISQFWIFRDARRPISS